MKKLIVRIFNILFIVAAGVAVFCFATQPLISLEVSATVKKEAVGDLAAQYIQGEEEGSNEEGSGEGGNIEPSYIVRDVKRDESPSSQFDIKSALSAEKVSNAVGDITITIPLKIEAKQCFDFKNEKVFNDIIKNNIEPVLSNTVSTISPKFKNLVKSVTMDFAKDVMKEQVAAQVLQNFGENIPVDEQKINDLVENVYAKLDNKTEGETTTVKELSNAIIGDKNYVSVGTITEEQFSKKTHFKKVGEEYLKAETYESEVEYFVEEFGDGVRGILQDIQKQQEAEGKEVTQINFDEIDMTDIENQMVVALDNIPNLTQRNEADPQPTADTFALDTYYVKNDLGGYEVAEEFKEGEIYYNGEVSISSIDDALIGLLDILAGKTGGSEPQPIVEGEGQTETEGNQEPPTSAILRSRVNKADEPAAEGSQDRVAEKVKTVIYQLVPFDDFMESDLSLGGYAPLILFGLVLLAMLPWMLFILVSLIRTIRPNKCWTKTWIVLVFAFLQVIFGIGLTIGLKYTMPLLTGMLEGMSVGEGGKTLGDMVTGMGASLKTSAFIPSIIYLVFIPLSIIFIIVRHSVVRDYREMKKNKKAAKAAKKAA